MLCYPNKRGTAFVRLDLESILKDGPLDRIFISEKPQPFEVGE
jgi:hypothetical protein